MSEDSEGPDCSWCGGDGRVYGVISGWGDCPYCEGSGVEQPEFRRG